MRLLAREQITVQPKQQTLSNGTYALSNDGASFTIWGSIQPIGRKDLERIPEGSRASAEWVIYTEGGTDAIDIGGRPGEPPDHLTTSKGTLIPIASIDYSTHTTGLGHVAYACMSVGSDE
jgi:hypothetical protein